MSFYYPLLYVVHLPATYAAYFYFGKYYAHKLSGDLMACLVKLFSHIGNGERQGAVFQNFQYPKPQNARSVRVYMFRKTFFSIFFTVFQHFS